MEATAKTKTPWSKTFLNSRLVSYEQMLQLSHWVLWAVLSLQEGPAGHKQYEEKTIKQLPCLRSKVKLAGMVTNYLHTSPEVLITRSGTEKRDLNKVSKMSKS